MSEQRQVGKPRDVWVNAEIDGHSIRTLNLEGLLKTKVSSREKDIADHRVLSAAISRIKKEKTPDRARHSRGIHKDDLER